MAAQTWIDTTVFYNVYRDLLSIEGVVLANKLRGITSGIEVAGHWLVDSAWRYDVAYTYWNLDLVAEADSVDLARPAVLADSAPRHQLVVPHRGLRVSAVGQNLLDRGHPEQSGATSAEVQRGFYLKLSWDL